MEDLARAGGKGARLGELIRAGFDVPAGFVVTTVAYEQAAAETGVQGLAAAPVPEALQREIRERYRRLGGGPVAVRSSATAEDLEGAAFAGQQETFLNVIGDERVFDAVRACWASLWSPRAVAYRERRGVDPAGIAIAVVVQRMAAADAAGVMFTADPVSGARGSLCIDGNPGLGEAVVSGLVTPERFVLSRKPLRIVERRPGRRELEVRPRDGGGTEQRSAVPAEEPLMPEAAILRLARQGLRIERHFRSPQDIEWAWARDGRGPGKLVILQSRPMTALPSPRKVNAAMRRVIPLLVEMWPERPYPFDLSTFSGAVERSVGRFLSSLIGKAAPDPESALVEQDGVVLRFEPPAVKPSPMMILSLLSALLKTRRFRPEKWSSDPVLEQSILRARDLGSRDAAAMSWEEILQTLREALEIVADVMALRERYAPPALVKLAGLWIRLRTAGRGASLGRLLGAVETKTSETNRALEDLARRVRSDDGLRELFSVGAPGEVLARLPGASGGRAFLAVFSDFLAAYGHREIGLTVSRGSWRDSPETVIGILQALTPGGARSPGAAPDWQAARDEVLASTYLGARPFRRGFLRSLEASRALFQLREDTHFYATMALPIVRAASLELGRRLAGIGALPEASDILHLKLEEVAGLGPWPPSRDQITRLNGLALRRKALRESLSSRPLFDPDLLSPVPSNVDEPGILLSGSPGSPGVARGPVRVVRTESDFPTLRPGDVLVAPLTNPAWTPLFTRAAAVVVDAGGAASHAAIVAREYGVPAVMGTGDGTRKLKDGQRVVVDGTRGLVKEEVER